MASIDPLHMVCPCCGCSSGHAFYSSYERNMISFSEGLRKDYTVSIPRIRCHCGHTHAIIPDVLIPYGSYSLRFILQVLCDYLTRSCPVDELCLRYQIVRSTLYSWIHLFITHHNLLAGILKSVDSLSLNEIAWISSYEHLSADFFDRFRFSFMQPHHLTTVSDTA